MRRPSFHFAMRSEREKLPTLSWGTPQPTARCTIDTSSVSPERAETIARGERTAKWNEMLRLEEALRGRARFSGRAALGFAA